MLGLEDNLPRIEAQRALEEIRKTGDAKLSAARLYYLVLAATEDKQQAEEQCFLHAQMQLKSGITPQMPE